MGHVRAARCGGCAGEALGKLGVLGRMTLGPQPTEREAAPNGSSGHRINRILPAV